MVVCQWAEKELKTPLGVLVVKGQLLHAMAAGGGTGGAAAGKGHFGRPLAGLQKMRLKKRYGQKRDVLPVPDGGRSHTQVVNKGGVNRVVLSLKAKYLQCNIIEGVVVYRV